MSIICDFKSNGVIAWHQGVINSNDLIQANKKIYSHKYDEGLEFQLIDVTKVEEFNVSPEDMRILAEMDRNEIKHKKQFACVVAPSDSLFGMARMWNIQSEENNFENNVVRSMEEAITWFKSKDIKISV